MFTTILATFIVGAICNVMDSLPKDGKTKNLIRRVAEAARAEEKDDA